MKLKEKLALEHAQSEGDNGNAEISFLAGFEKALEMCRDVWKEARENDNDLEPSDLNNVGEEEV